VGHHHVYYYPQQPPQNNDHELRNALTRESKIDLRKPDAFTGRDCLKWRPFLIECRVNFNAKPNTYATDHAKITFAASYLSGTAQSHYASLLEHDPGNPMLTNWDSFVREFGTMFSIVNMEIFAEQMIRSLTMGEHDNFATHIVKFEEYAFLCNWNYPALQAELQRLLLKHIKDILQTIPHPQHYQDLRALCLQIDTRFWEDELEN
jgi:hypothetical protein